MTGQREARRVRSTATRTPEQVLNDRLQPYDFVEFQEKYDSAFYSLTSGSETSRAAVWGEICYCVASLRDHDGWYFEPKALPEPSKVDPNAPIEEQEEQLFALKRYLRRKVEVDEESTQWLDVLKMRTGDRAAAIRLIEARRRYEYEGYEFHHFQELGGDQ